MECSFSTYSMMTLFILQKHFLEPITGLFVVFIFYETFVKEVRVVSLIYFYLRAFLLLTYRYSVLKVYNSIINSFFFFFWYSNTMIINFCFPYSILLCQRMQDAEASFILAARNSRNNADKNATVSLKYDLLYVVLNNFLQKFILAQKTIMWLKAVAE